MLFRIAALCALSVPTATAQVRIDPAPPRDVIQVAGQSFASWQAYTQSPLFKQAGLRCASKLQPKTQFALAPSDCSFASTNPTAAYDPVVVYEIQVVFHVLQNTSGTGFLSAARIQSQIDILNEDFLAIAGTNGANGNDAAIQFVLATTDPDGNPTTGITYNTNNNWYNDNGAYWNSLAWDTNRYMNVYTNTASGALGYVPDLPQGGLAGQNNDRIVMLWSSIGANGPIGPPYNQGRTLTHEVGHYLGLYHTFDNGCGSAASCYTSGDRICDTERESGPNFGCTGNGQSCSSPDPIRNYMDYSDDLCMEEFTPEQVRRMRCTLENWRPQLATVVNGGGGANVYCVAKLNSEFCLPQISFSGAPSATGGSFALTADMVVNNKNGLLFYGYTAANVPFQGGALCVQPPLRRTSIQGSGGNPPPNDCSGSYAFDMNAWIQSGVDPLLTSGVSFNAQFWSRDPASTFGTGLTDAVQATIQP